LHLQHADDNNDNQGTDIQLRVLLCPDQPSWAFDNIAKNIAEFSGANQVFKLYMQDIIGNEHLLFEKIFLNRIDLCHLFWREDFFYLLHPQTIDNMAGQLGLDYETLVRAINGCAFTSSVYDHLFSSHEELQARRTGFALLDGYTVSSHKLHSIYTSESGLPPPDKIIPDGVDTAHFTPRKADATSTGKFAIGWAGNSAWGIESQGYDVKGYQRLFRPVMEDLAERGHVVEEIVANPQVKRIPFSEMPDFYRKLDVFVCTSDMEGTPNTVLEAMACGIPIVTTDVGIVTEAFGDLQKKFIIHQTEIDEFANGLAQLLDDANLRRAISTENRTRALDWTWEKQTKDWWPFWNAALMRATENRTAIRREFSLLSRKAFL